MSKDKSADGSRTDWPCGGRSVVVKFRSSILLTPFLLHSIAGPLRRQLIWSYLQVCLLSARRQSCFRPFASRGFKTSLVGYVQWLIARGSGLVRGEGGALVVHEEEILYYISLSLYRTNALSVRRLFRSGP